MTFSYFLVDLRFADIILAWGDLLIEGSQVG